LEHDLTVKNENEDENGEGVDEFHDKNSVEYKWSKFTVGLCVLKTRGFKILNLGHFPSKGKGPRTQLNQRRGL
jgi:hypothetical protein